MFEKFPTNLPEKSSDKKDDKGNISRRTFIKGLGSSLLLSQIPFPVEADAKTTEKDEKDISKKVFFEQNFKDQIEDLEKWLYVELDDNETVKQAKKIGFNRISDTIELIKKDGSDIKVDDLNLIIEIEKSKELIELIKNRKKLFNEVSDMLGKSGNDMELIAYNWDGPKNEGKITSLNQIPMLSTLDLLRTYLMLNAVKSSDTLKEIASLINQDIKNTDREYGGLVELDNKGKLNFSLKNCKYMPELNLNCYRGNDDSEPSWQSLKHPIEGISYFHIHHPELEKDSKKKWKVHQPSDTDASFARQTITSFLFSPKSMNDNDMVINMDIYFGKGKNREHYAIDIGDYKVEN